MKKRVLGLVLIATLIMTMSGFGEVVSDLIEARMNSIHVELNGQPVVGDNLLYEGTTYVPLKIMTEMIGGTVGWNGETRTASVMVNNSNTDSNQVASSSKNILLEGFTNPVISYASLGVNKDEIYGVVFKNTDTPISYSLTDEGLVWEKNLSLNESQEIIVLLIDGTQLTRNLKSDKLSKITIKDDYQVLYIPAMPEKGFNFPFMLRVQGNGRTVTATGKKYLMVDSTNGGSGEQVAYDFVEGCMNDRKQMTGVVAEQLGYPLMMPILPRNGVFIEMDGSGTSNTYEHALDRDSVYIRELVTTDSNKTFNKSQYENANVDPTLYYDLDNQINEMVKFAVGYLNDSNLGIEEKVIMMGYSATGTFTDRFTNLHPESVAMVVSGGTVDDMMLPLTTYKGESLSFPVGISDFKAITGKEFDLEKHNDLARLIFMGKDDTNNVVGYSDCYFSKTNEQIIRLFGKPVLPRAYENIKLYGEYGGEGMFILDQGIKHGFSRDMEEYITKFIVDNSYSDTVVYPVPTKSNLEYTLFND